MCGASSCTRPAASPLPAFPLSLRIRITPRHAPTALYRRASHGKLRTRCRAATLQPAVLSRPEGKRLLFQGFLLASSPIDCPGHAESRSKALRFFSISCFSFPFSQPSSSHTCFLYFGVLSTGNRSPAWRSNA
ncbi:hypothetical protein DIE03_29920 [Burkholderia sp. Bp8992]|nr:hypothetical protein DIE03_29920 [Burkholderia sp. Bp8992]